jgi:hypothetical protein
MIVLMNGTAHYEISGENGKSRTRAARYRPLGRPSEADGNFPDSDL